MLFRSHLERRVGGHELHHRGRIQRRAFVEAQRRAARADFLHDDRDAALRNPCGGKRLRDLRRQLLRLREHRETEQAGGDEAAGVHGLDSREDLKYGPLAAIIGTRYARVLAGLHPANLEYTATSCNYSGFQYGEANEDPSIA